MILTYLHKDIFSNICIDWLRCVLNCQSTFCPLLQSLNVPQFSIECHFELVGVRSKRSSIWTWIKFHIGKDSENCTPIPPPPYPMHTQKHRTFHSKQKCIVLCNGRIKVLLYWKRFCNSNSMKIRREALKPCCSILYISKLHLYNTTVKRWNKHKQWRVLQAHVVHNTIAYSFAR